ncbi:Nse4 C-terminal-domain-containing protein [Amylocystis lapponica]|nr:Nse4 C-terminal-domain-containing protein [Amylocystis lapponica]
MQQASSRSGRRREVTYDPDQDPEERRALRRDYRDLNKLAEDAQSNEFTPDQLAENVRRADLLFDKVKGTSEATLDSQFLLRATQLGAAKARAMKSGAGAFDLDDFVARLVTFMGGRKSVQLNDDSDNDDDDDNGEPLDWERIGRRALAKSRRVPVMDFMLGPLSIEQKKRNAAKRSKLEKNKNDEKKPQEITEDDITRSENETTKNVATLERILETTGEVNLFKFIINPDDFGQSVENLFYISFLIRDGKCVLETNKEAEPIVYLCAQPTEEDYSSGLRKQQLIMEFDMATWRRAIEVFNITEPMIPQRPKSEMRLGGKWYG